MLGQSLIGVASELRLIDAADFIAFIRMGQIANLRNIVNYSTELHFKPSTLRLSEHGEIELTWSRASLFPIDAGGPVKRRYRWIS